MELLRGFFHFAELTAIVSPAGRTNPVGQTICAALGAGNDTGSIQLPMGAASLITSRFRYLSLGDRHLGDTSLVIAALPGTLNLQKSIVQQLSQLGQTGIDLPLALAGAEVQVGATAGAEPLAVL